MRREMRTVRADTRLSAFRRDFPPVAEAHLETLGAERVADLLRLEQTADHLGRP